MATVYLARDVRQGRRVAIKVLHPDLSVALGAERFLREISIASSLTHPHVVPLYESGEASGSLYYVMPYVEGETLRARLDRQKQLPLEDAIRIACEIASALDYAHRHGVVHRDVKPANILLEDGHAVIADFGIARALSRATDEHTLTMTGVTLGTPSYMSPEQASAEREIDGRSDIYALGCVVYEMLAGQPPFTGPNPQAVMARHAMDTVPSIRVVRSIIPPEVEAAIFCALAKSPADRFATAQQFADALTGVGTSTTLRYTARWAIARTRRRRLWTLVIVAGLLVPVGAAGAWWAFGRDAAGAGQLAANLEPAFEPSRIAVLYFEDDSRSDTLGFLADGLTESLIEELEGVRNLSVVSRHGVERFRGAQALDSVATALRVGTLVRGSVEDVGDRIRVNVRIYDSDGVEYGREAFLQPSAAILDARDSVAEQVGEFLRHRLRADIQLRQHRAGTTIAAAWSLVQRAERSRRDGIALVRTDSAAAAQTRFAEADSLLARAEVLDPRWVAPRLGRAELVRRMMLLERNPVRARRLADSGVTLVERALMLDPRSADALELRGSLRFEKMVRGLETDPDASATLLRRAEEDLRAALALDPSHAPAWYTLSRVHYRRYNRIESNLAARRAYEADAYLEASREILWQLYATSYDLEQFVDAIDWCTEGHRRYPRDPLFVRCQLWLLTTNAVEPDPAAGWRLVGRLDSLAASPAGTLLRREARMVVAAAIGRSGMADSARRVLEAARGDPSIDPHGNLLVVEAAVRTMIGDHDVAIQLLQRYLTANPVHREGFVKNNAWWWKPLHGDPRFKLLIGTRN